MKPAKTMRRVALLSIILTVCCLLCCPRLYAAHKSRKFTTATWRRAADHSYGQKRHALNARKKHNRHRKFVGRHKARVRHAYGRTALSRHVRTAAAPRKIVRPIVFAAPAPPMPGASPAVAGMEKPPPGYVTSQTPEQSAAAAAQDAGGGRGLIATPSSGLVSEDAVTGMMRGYNYALLKEDGSDRWVLIIVSTIDGYTGPIRKSAVAVN